MECTADNTGWWPDLKQWRPGTYMKNYLSEIKVRPVIHSVRGEVANEIKYRWEKLNVQLLNTPLYLVTSQHEDRDQVPNIF